MVTFFVSPDGSGDGNSEGSPIHYLSEVLWNSIKTIIDDEHVIVVFLDGVYDSVKTDDDKSPGFLKSLVFESFGSSAHYLTLKARQPDQTTFRVPPDSPSQEDMDCLDKENPRMTWMKPITINDSININIEGIVFSGPGSVQAAIQLRNSNHILIKNCVFKGMTGIQYGAIRNFASSYIVVDNCWFEHIGCDGHAHMIYNANPAENIIIKNCHFEECSGDYVRFRNQMDRSVVHNCTFKHTGEYYSPYPFIAVTLFNDCEPGTIHGNITCPKTTYKGEHQYEYFGTHFVFANNNFVYERLGSRNFAILFHHKGWSPPGRNHLLTLRECIFLRYGRKKTRRAILWENCGINTKEVIVYGNSYSGLRKKAAFESYPGYDAPSKGCDPQGSSAIDIFKLLNPDEEIDPVISYMNLEGDE